MEALVTVDLQKAKVLRVFFGSASTSKTSLWEVQVPETEVNSWNKEEVALVEEEQVREYLNNLGIQKSMGPEGMPPCVLRQLAVVIKWPLKNL